MLLGHNMFGFIETVLGRLGGSALLSGFNSLILFFRPKKISRSKAPRNFFEHFGPGVTQSFVTNSIGAPHRQYESFWLYQFVDALAQFDFHPNGSARSVALALTNDSPRAGFPIPAVEVPLGKLTFDSLTNYEDGKFCYRNTIRTWELLYHVKFLPSWASNYYTFGALCVQAPGVLSEPEFDFNIARLSPRIAAKGTRINWVGVSDTSDELWFDWSIAMPIAA